MPSFSTSCAVISVFMGSPFVNLVGVETISVVKRAAHHFQTHHLFDGCACWAYSFPPTKAVLHGKVQRFLRNWVAGLFLIGGNHAG